MMKEVGDLNITPQKALSVEKLICEFSLNSKIFFGCKKR